MATLGRLGIYSDDDYYPGSLALDAGEVDLSTSGAKEIVINQALSPGLYWLVLLVNNWTDLTATKSEWVPGFHGMPSSGGNNPGVLLAKSQAYGGLPTPFPGGGSYSTDSVVHFIYMRKA